MAWWEPTIGHNNIHARPDQRRYPEFAKYTLCGVVPTVSQTQAVTSYDKAYPNALLVVWVFGKLVTGHVPHCLLLDDQHAVMLSHLNEAVYYWKDYERGPPRELITITGENRDATMHAVITTMQLLHSLPI